MNSLCIYPLAILLYCTVFHRVVSYYILFVDCEQKLSLVYESPWNLVYRRPPPSLYLSLNREGRWGIAEHFATSFLHLSLFSTALLVLANSRPVHSLMLSSHLFFCLPCLLPPCTVPCKMMLARPDEGKTWPYYCSLRLFTMVRGSSCRSWHRLPRW